MIKAIYGVIFLSVIVLTETLDLKCDFELSFDEYRCSPVSYTFDSTQQMIGNVIGDHSINKSNNEVNIFSLSGVSIKGMPIGLNKHFPNLEVVSVLSCSLGAISKQTFQGLSKLRKIDLFINNIKVLPDHAFDDLQDLEDLQLGQNEIEHLEPDIFNKLTSLKLISLTSNKVTFLKHTLFVNNVKLEKIYFDNNKIQKVDELLFEKLIQLKTVSLSNNLIEFLNPNIFKHNDKLEVIDFSGNRIIKLHKNLFHNNMNLKMINFDGNRITFIGKELLDHLQFGADNLKQARFAKNICLNVFYEMLNSVKYEAKSVTNITLLSQIHHNCTEPIVVEVTTVVEDKTVVEDTTNYTVPIFLSVIGLILLVLLGLICCYFISKKQHQKSSTETELGEIRF